MSDKKEILKKARDERSLKKRNSVENAIIDLRNSNDAITFKAVATLASVSRQYLYNNFKDVISKERDKTREVIQTIDGIKVPTRTPDEYRHIEALLRSKIDRTKSDLTKARRELATTKQMLERERGKSEHFRQLWLKRESTESDV
ncbi:MAG: hypothetical protein QM504_07805 [Pseudomonadota bacterium]